eukprot:3887082-Pleurochrysis_carterae.AAC.2
MAREQLDGSKSYHRLMRCGKSANATHPQDDLPSARCAARLNTRRFWHARLQCNIRGAHEQQSEYDVPLRLGGDA